MCHKRAYEDLEESTSIQFLNNPMKNKILIVTENREFGILLETFLSGSFEIEAAVSNSDAMTVIRTGSFSGLVISDMLVPISECMDLISLVRESSLNNQVPIMLMAGKNRANEVNELLKVGANDYIFKPFSLSELENRIMNLFKKSTVSA
jgi:DNA-binding response OmpR family regulator